jgi:hypothetical protein
MNLHFMLLLRMLGYVSPLSPTHLRRDAEFSARVTYISVKNFVEFKVCIFGIVGGGVQLGPIGTLATNRPIVPAPGDYDDGEIGGMIGRGNRSTWRKPAPVPFCPPQTPHAARTRTRAAAVGSQRLTA